MNVEIASINAISVWYITYMVFVDLRLEQDNCGEPTNPSGHVHIGSCFVTLQFAFGAHTFGFAQGLIHFLDSHAV